MPRLNTRILLSCAAIGVVTGLLFMVTGGLHIIVITIAPWAYGALIGMYFLPGAIAQGTYRLPLVGLITIVLAGLLTAISPIQSLGWAVFAYLVMIGVLQELPWAVTGYRRRTRTGAVIGSLVSGALLGLLFALVFQGKTGSVWLDVAQAALTVVSVLLFTLLGWVIAKALHRAGVGRA
ncbi:ECF transporter S component [Pseudoclavibacter sp. CFCC 13796]|uniref:ECF transporter S component n=1 Tax=Pseudoclavibacter sp. CFCC 13796 TaxID=2615179 RepID=UPI00130123FB|nr:ECF transporter S component [Pseudoclavibacter sp. CFCC 13796]KAB1661714.1 ECF transporter S component [Pseudoclavibacter sp. CFCC 13796]